MPDYAKGKIYVISSPTTDKVYIGSTTKRLSARFQDHKSHFISWMEGKSNYSTAYEILEQGDAEIELLECWSCSCREELDKRERVFIENNPNCVNKNTPARTDSENKEIRRNYIRALRSVEKLNKKSS